MKLFKLEVTDKEPMTIITKSYDDAQVKFIDGMLRGFGHLPDTSTVISEWRPKQTEQNKSLLDFARAGRSGSAWLPPDGGGWQIFDPSEG